VRVLASATTQIEFLHLFASKQDYLVADEVGREAGAPARSDNIARGHNRIYRAKADLQKVGASNCGFPTRSSKFGTLVRKRKAGANWRIGNLRGGAAMWRRLKCRQARCQHSALHREWPGDVSHGHEARVGEQLFRVHCAEVVEDEGAGIA
jgi:hypothetical protein